MPAPLKQTVKKNEIEKLKDSVCSIRVSSDTKIHLFRYFYENDPGIIQYLRSKIIVKLFNSDTALYLSHPERNIIQSWYNSMTNNLVPSLDSFNQIERDKIIAIIAKEAAELKKTPESVKILNELLGLIKARG